MSNVSYSLYHCVFTLCWDYGGSRLDGGDEGDRRCPVSVYISTLLFPSHYLVSKTWSLPVYVWIGWLAGWRGIHHYNHKSSRQMWRGSIHGTSYHAFSMYSSYRSVGVQAHMCERVVQRWSEKVFDAFAVLWAKLLHILQPLLGRFKYMALCFYLFCFVRVLLVCYSEAYSEAAWEQTAVGNVWTEGRGKEGTMEGNA